MFFKEIIFKVKRRCHLSKVLFQNKYFILTFNFCKYTQNVLRLAHDKVDGFKTKDTG